VNLQLAGNFAIALQRIPGSKDQGFFNGSDHMCFKQHRFRAEA